MGLINDALKYAMTMHNGQSRRYTGEDFVQHPINVANTVDGINGSSVEMVAAALLHDVLEDTSATKDVILKMFGREVVKMVVELTSVETPVRGKNRAVRKAFDLMRLSKISDDAKTIKLADILDNSPSIIKYDPSFAKVYIKERKHMLKVLKGGDAGLHRKATKMIDDYLTTQ